MKPRFLIMTIMAASLMLSCDGFMPENSQGGV